MPRTALVVGATGLVGGHVIDFLFERESWSRVIVLARRSLGRTHPKLEEHLVDFERLDAHRESFAGAEDVFACLGTTKKAAGSDERRRRIDHDYTVEAARLAHEVGASRLALVSSVGASESASSFYLRVKGDTERDVRALGYDQLVIAQPSFLQGDRAEDRPGEAVGIAVSRVLSRAMIGPLRTYRPIDARVVAAALVNGLSRDEPGVRVLTYDDLIATANG
jgi:uncharacterized protein YbjT (DUF2867 family)